MSPKHKGAKYKAAVDQALAEANARIDETEQMYPDDSRRYYHLRDAHQDQAIRNVEIERELAETKASLQRLMSSAEEESARVNARLEALTAYSMKTAQKKEELTKLVSALVYAMGGDVTLSEATLTTPYLLLSWEEPDGMTLRSETVPDIEEMDR